VQHAERDAIGQLGTIRQTLLELARESSWLTARPGKLAANAFITASFSQTPVVGFRFTCL
jgi:hypothetical protein